MKIEEFEFFYNLKEIIVDDLCKDLEAMYAVPGGWSHVYVGRLNDKFDNFNKKVRSYNPTPKEAQQLYIKIILLGSNS